MRRLILLAALVGCASMGAPPGGPVDKEPPKLLSTSPESGAVNAQPKAVTFRFDKVINETPQGASSLDQLFLISPTDGGIRTNWHRSSIDVRGRRGWRPNTTYTVTLLPGLSDLRGNARKDGALVVFSTGSTIPSTRIVGTIFDWVAGTPAAHAAIEAVASADSQRYLAQSDSLGHFTIPYLPPGSYHLRGYIDANTNRTLDPREPWDSAHVDLRDSATVELLAVVRDTIGPRINTVDVRDSVTLHVAFDKPIDPAQRIDSSLFRLTGADSAALPLQRVVPARELEQARSDSARVADSARARTDTARRQQPPETPRPGRARADTTQVALPKPSRPSPVTDVVLVLARPLQLGATYRLDARDVRGIGSKPETSSRTFVVPKPTAEAPGKTPEAVRRPAATPPPRRTPADTARPPAESGRPPADSARRPPQ